MPGRAVPPEYGVWFEAGAAFTCLAGSHSALMLAAASIRLQLPKLMVLAALQFMVQSIFSLHFVAMCGMRFGVPWGFDLGLTAASLAVAVIFGTAGLTLALNLRRQLEPAVRERFGDEPSSVGLAHHGRLLAFILARVSLAWLLLAVVLVVVGAAGCHHLGMLAIHGLNGEPLMSELTLWSCLTTVVLGGVVCVLAVLSFLLVPEGPATPLVAVLLAGGIAAFHFASATWGLRYVVGEEGVTTGFVVGEEAIIMFIVSQGAVSQLITAVFSRMAMDDHAALLKQEMVAQTLSDHIAHMDLEPAKQIQLEAVDPSPLERTLFQIVDNLVLYRPYLPDTLFSGHQDSDKEEEEAVSVRSASTLQSYVTGLTRRFTQHNIAHARQRPSGSTACSAGQGFHRLPGAHGNARARRTSKNLALGLRSSHLTVLRIRLQGLQFGGDKFLNHEQVEDALTQFMELTTAHIKAQGGTIVLSASGTVVAMWSSISPDAAVEAAIAIQRECEEDLIQVVQSGFFLAGNLAAEHLRSFNLVGPMDWPGQLLLRLGAGGRHIFVTSNEWERVHFKYLCLPYEQVLLGSEPTTVFDVLPHSKGPNDTTTTEWMYEVSNNLQAASLEAVTGCWQAYLRGRFEEARAAAATLANVPPWYPQHLMDLVQRTSNAHVRTPTKCLEWVGWPQTPTTGHAHRDLPLLRES